MRHGYSGVAALLGALIALQLLTGQAPWAAGPAREITLLTSASLDGELKPCGCKLEPKGGLSRRAWYYAEVRRKHSATLTVEAGDFARAPDEFEGANVSGFMAATLGKLRYDEVAPLDSWEVLRMGTITGARAVGLDHEIGSLEPGKRADIIAVRTDIPRMTPVFADGPWFNLHHNLVHAVRGGDVAMTMVDGEILVEDGKLLTGDLDAIIAEIHRLAPGLFERRAAYLAGIAGDMVQWTTAG